MKKIKPNSGFTLIELLVVIAIIGLLSSLVLAGLSVARGKARDARRLSDMQQMKNALELYRSTHGVYPSGEPIMRENSCGRNDSNQGLPVTQWGSALTSLVTEKNISSLSQDPSPTSVDAQPPYCYGYASFINTSYYYMDCVQYPVQNPPQYARASDYEYILYLNLENPPATGYRLAWYDGSGAPAPYPPFNTCILGPHR